MEIIILLSRVQKKVDDQKRKVQHSISIPCVAFYSTKARRADQISDTKPGLIKSTDKSIGSLQAWPRIRIRVYRVASVAL